jgi:hypothetical protein
LNQDAKYEEILVRYLLGEISEEEQQRVEEQYIGNNEFFERLLVVEDELIDRYVRHQLSNHERERFEMYFLRTPARRKRLEFAETWNYYTSVLEKPVRTLSSIKPIGSPAAFPLPSRRAFWVVAAAALALVLGCSWLLIDRTRLKREIEASNAQQSELERERQQLRQQIDEQNARSLPPAYPPDDRPNSDKQIEPDPASNRRPSISIVSLILAPGSVRGRSEANKLQISPGIRKVRLKVRFAGEEYESYRVVISTVEGRKVYDKPARKDKADPSGKVISVVMPASVFTVQDYTLRLSGVTATGDPEYIGEYFFRVIRK